MNAYSNRQSLDLNSIVFLFNGCKIQEEQTPDEVFLSSLLFLTFEMYVINQHYNTTIFMHNFSARNGAW